MTPEQIDQNPQDGTTSPPPIKSLFSSDWETPKEDATSTYKQVSVLGVLAILIGLISFAAFLEVHALFFSALGILISLIAYVVIVRSEGVLVGKRLAIIGLACSVFSLAGVVTKWTYYQYSVRHEADRFCRIWFDAVKSRNLVLIFSMSNPSWQRNLNPNMDDWWKNNIPNFESKVDREERMSVFFSKLDSRLLRALWFLGDRAVPTYYKTESVTFSDNKDTVIVVYAITYTDSDGEKKTFFAKFTIERFRNASNPHQVGWLINDFPSYVKIPDELKTQTASPAK